MINAVEVSRLEFLPKREPGVFTCANPRDYVPRMSSSALFEGLSTAECGEVSSFAKIKAFFRNEMLFHQGEPVRKLIWIQTGRVKLTHVSADGNEVLLWVNGSGQAADLQSDSHSHRCSARAMERCEALMWDHGSFRALAVRYPQINANIAGILAARLHELEERFCEIATLGVADRLAQSLLRLADSVGKRSPFGVEIEISRRELAQLTGTNLCTVSRTLSKWALAGTIVARRSRVLIRHPERLRVCDDRRRLELSPDPWPRDRSAQRGSYSPSAQEA